MGTNKKRIQAYVSEETIPKFRIVTALKGYKSMSEYAGELIEKSINDYEVKHGPIPLKHEGGVINNILHSKRGGESRIIRLPPYYLCQLLISIVA